MLFLWVFFVFVFVLVFFFLLYHPSFLCPAFRNKRYLFKVCSKLYLKPFLLDVPQPQHLGFCCTHVSDSLVTWDVVVNCKIHILSRHLPWAPKLSFPFLPMSPATCCLCCGEKPVMPPPTPQHCYLPKKRYIHLLLLENAKGQWERNPWTWSQGAFPSWWEL